MEEEQLSLLREFVTLVKSNPDVLRNPKLSFFTDWLLSLGAKLPLSSADTARTIDSDVDSGAEESSEESEIEFDDDAEIIKDTSTVLEEMGDESVEVTEEMISQADEKRTEAQLKMSEGDIEGAIHMFTEAIKLNPSSALLYAKRASCFVKLKRPNAAIRDCNKAISLNADSATPYKWRGFAYKMIGEWQKAYEDLQLSLKLDYSDDANEALKDVEPKHKRIFEHNMKYKRKREEKLEQQRRERVRKAQEAREKARQEAQSEHAHGDMGDAFSQLFSDPDLMEAINDPEVMKAFTEVTSNPAAMHKYENNPKVKKVLEKMKSKFGGGMGGGMPFGAGPGFTMPTHSAPDLD